MGFLGRTIKACSGLHRWHWAHSCERLCAILDRYLTRRCSPSVLRKWVSPGCRYTSVLGLGNMQLVEQMSIEGLTKLCLSIGQGCMVHHHGGQEGHPEEGAGPDACARRAQRAQHAVHAGPHAALGPRLVLRSRAASEEEAAGPGSACCRKARSCYCFACVYIAMSSGTIST